MTKIRLATRGSPLALKQADTVAQYLGSKLGGDAVFEKVVIKTTGDKRQDWSLEKYGGKGFTPAYAAKEGGMHSQDYHITMDIPPASVTYLVPGKKITFKKKKTDKEGESK